jgi:hypothetical protein
MDDREFEAAIRTWAVKAFAQDPIFVLRVLQIIGRVRDRAVTHG